MIGLEQRKKCIYFTSTCVIYSCLEFIINFNSTTSVATSVTLVYAFFNS